MTFTYNYKNEIVIKISAYQFLTKDLESRDLTRNLVKHIKINKTIL